jgi:hypothetical protein
MKEKQGTMVLAVPEPEEILSRWIDAFCSQIDHHIWHNQRINTDLIASKIRGK